MEKSVKNTQNKQNFRAARAEIIKTLPKMISEICDWQNFAKVQILKKNTE